MLLVMHSGVNNYSNAGTLKIAIWFIELKKKKKKRSSGKISGTPVNEIPKIVDH